MKHKVRHSLGLEKARAVADAAWASYSERFSNYGPTLNWEDNNCGKIGFTVKGVSLKGSIEVLADSIDLDLNVPLLLRPFKSKAIGVIEQEIQGWIAKSEAGEL